VESGEGFLRGMSRGVWLKVLSNEVGSILRFEILVAHVPRIKVFTIKHELCITEGMEERLELQLCICKAVIAASQSYLSNSLPSMH
jgi:hypothetical protein